MQQHKSITNTTITIRQSNFTEYFKTLGMLNKFHITIIFMLTRRIYARNFISHVTRMHGYRCLNNENSRLASTNIAETKFQTEKSQESGLVDENLIKRKVALVIGYVGTEFKGLQMQRDTEIRTVESVLEKALYEAGAIKESNYGDLKKIGWSRTSRTDKGVHAAKTVVVAKLIADKTKFCKAGLHDELKNAVNQRLPPDLRVFSVCKVRKGFNGRTACSWRDYEYYLPSALFKESEAIDEFGRLLKLFCGTHSYHNFISMKGRELRDKWKEIEEGRMSLEESNSSDQLESSVDSEEVRMLLEESDSSDQLEPSVDNNEEGNINLSLENENKIATRKILKEMTTSIYKMELEKLKILVGSQEESFLRIHIRGQAFLYNQIRLMVGAAIAEANGVVPQGWIRSGLIVPYTLHFPLAPAEGLLLVSQGFTRGRLGNAAVLDPAQLAEVGGTVTEWGEDNRNLECKGRLQALMGEFDVKEANEFRETQIIPKIASSWINEKLGETWLNWADEQFRLKSGPELDTLMEAIRTFEDSAREKDEAEFEKEKSYRIRASERENARIKECLPKGFATQLISQMNMLPGKKVTAIQQAIISRMKANVAENQRILSQNSTGEISPGRIDFSSDISELLDEVKNVGIDNLARDGGFLPME